MNTPLRNRFRTLFALGCLATASLTLTACGSGGGGSSGTLSACDPNSFTPNYARNLDHLLTWSGFPLTVFFVQDANFTAARRTRALAGFDQWVNVSGGTLTYTMVDSAQDADVTVRFDPTTANGLTNIHFRGLEVVTTEVFLGVQDQSGPDLQCIAAHEFGHVLGIDGHSDSEADLMYPIHFEGSPCPITQRDLNTVKTGYCHAFGRSAARPRNRSGETGVITIR